jgi:hypothetical protein
VAGELSEYVAAAAPDTIVLDADGSGVGSREVLGADGTTQVVTVLTRPPAAPGAVAVRWARGVNGAAALQVATQLAVANNMNLVVAPGGGRRGAAMAAGLARRGIAASDGPLPAGALLVAAADDGSDGAHLTVLAGSNEGSDDLDQWVEALDERRIL